MKCSKCNSVIKDGMKFCPKCGSEIMQIHFCPKCGAELKEGMKFCPKCGCSTCDNSAHVDNSDSPMDFTNSSNGISCPICNQALSINDQVCPNCHRELFYKCFSCNNDITYGEIIMNKGCCPKCGARIASLYNIPNEKYPFYVESQIQQQVQEEAGRLIKEGKAEMKKGLKLMFVGGAIILFFLLLGVLGENDASSSKNNSKDVEMSPYNSNVLGTCKYCGSTITVDSPHECSNVCSRPECKKQYEHYMYKNMYENVNGKGSYDRAVSGMQRKILDR